MPINQKYLADFEENELYHIYNRTNNQELLFLSDENRYFFLRKYAALLSPFISTYCWCLLPNHFHLLVRIKPLDEIKKYFKQLPKTNLTITEQQFNKRGDSPRCPYRKDIQKVFPIIRTGV